MAAIAMLSSLPWPSNPLSAAPHHSLLKFSSSPLSQPSIVCWWRPYRQVYRRAVDEDMHWSGFYRREMLAAIVSSLECVLRPLDSLAVQNAMLTKLEPVGLHAEGRFLKTLTSEIQDWSVVGDKLLNQYMMITTELRNYLDSTILGTMTASGQGFQILKVDTKDDFGGISLWLTCCTIIGLFLWQTHQARIANGQALEDMILKISVAEKEQCSRTNLATRLKLENEQVVLEASKDQQANKALLYHILSTKSQVVELQQQLDAEVMANKALRVKENYLSVTYQTSEHHHTLLIENLNKLTEKKNKLENDVMAANSKIKLKDESVSGLKMMHEEQENAVDFHLPCHNTRRFIDVESDEIQEFDTMRTATFGYLSEEDYMTQSLIGEHSAVAASNEALQRRLVDLNSQLNDQRCLSMEKFESLKECLDMKETDVCALTSKLANESEKLEKIMEAVNNLLEEKKDLIKTIDERRSIAHQLTGKLENATQALAGLNKEEDCLRREKTDVDNAISLLEQTCEMLQVESASRFDMVGKSVLMERIQDLEEVKRCLRISEKDAMLRDMDLKLQLKSYDKLKDTLLNVCQESEFASAALRQEKQDFTIAKERLDNSESALAKENIILRGLKVEQLQITNLLQESHALLPSLSKELESADAHAKCLESEVFLLQQCLAEERVLIGELQEKVDQLNSVKQKHAKQESTTKRTKKSAGKRLLSKNKMHQPKEEAVEEVLNDGLGAKTL